jgi:hypothetical protein
MFIMCLLIAKYLTGSQEVVGSTPIFSTINIHKQLNHCCLWIFYFSSSQHLVDLFEFSFIGTLDSEFVSKDIFLFNSE